MPSAGKNLRPAPSATKKKCERPSQSAGKTFGGGELKEFGFWCLERVKRYLIGDLESMQNGKLSLHALRVRHFK